jgi:hypothetical protein
MLLTWLSGLQDAKCSLCVCVVSLAVAVALLLQRKVWRGRVAAIFQSPLFVTPSRPIFAQRSFCPLEQ